MSRLDAHFGEHSPCTTKCFAPFLSNASVNQRNPVRASQNEAVYVHSDLGIAPIVDNCLPRGVSSSMDQYVGRVFEDPINQNSELIVANLACWVCLHGKLQICLSSEKLSTCGGAARRANDIAESRISTQI